MKVPLVDLKAQYRTIQRDIDAAIYRVINNSSFVLGEELEGFEKEFAAYIGAEYCVGVNNGTSALYLALKAVGVSQGHEVIIPVNTFIATAEAVSMLGATPVFVDIDSLSYDIDPTLIEAAITKRTKAIVPVHLYGQCADMTPILAIADKYDLVVVEDACQAHGAIYRDKRAGNLGHIAAFSFYPGKNLGCYGEGGAITTNYPEYAERIKLLRNHGGINKYEHQLIGGNYRLESLQAAILRTKLPHLDYWNTLRSRRSGWYDEMFVDSPVQSPKVYDYGFPVWHLYVIQVNERDVVLRKLQEKGIGAGVHYPYPIHWTPAYSHLTLKSFFVAEGIAKRIISLPMYPEITPEQVEYVSKTVLELVNA